MLIGQGILVWPSGARWPASCRLLRIGVILIFQIADGEIPVYADWTIVASAILNVSMAVRLHQTQLSVKV